jgi:hypothetical protein
MDVAREAAKKGLDLGVSAIRHAGWWLQWQADRHACREVADLKLLHPTAAPSEQPAA